MSFCPGTPGPFMLLIADGILWIGRKLGFFPKEPQSQEDMERIKKMLEEKGFTFSDDNNSR